MSIPGNRIYYSFPGEIIRYNSIEQVAAKPTNMNKTIIAILLVLALVVLFIYRRLSS